MESDIIGKPKYSEETCPEPPCSQQMSHDLTWAWAKAMVPELSMAQLNDAVHQFSYTVSLVY
jgi:hypothetical protein